MFSMRLLCAFTLLGIWFAAGCGKKPDPEVVVAPDQKLEPKPGPTQATPADKDEAVKRLHRIGVAMHNAESAYQFLPAGVVGPKGELGLSWRVAILPFLGKEEAELYQQFKSNEPWDSEHNKKLIAKMPKVFESPGKSAGEGKTYLRSFAGPLSIIPVPLPAPKGVTPPSRWAHRPAGAVAPGYSVVGITDGTSNTLLVAEAVEPVVWTKPEELPFLDPTPADVPNPPKLPPVPKLGGVFAGGFHGLMCDGKVHFFPDTLSEKSLRGMITVNGGELLGQDATAILFAPDPKRAKVPTAVPDTLPDAATRKTAVANYQTILKGLYAHHDAVGYLPAGIGAEKGVGLSWRVQILPYIGEEALYKEFKLNEPWDSEHNKKLLEKMPKVFESPSKPEASTKKVTKEYDSPGKPAAKGHTYVRTTHGKNGIIWTSGDGLPPPAVPAAQPIVGRKLQDLPDGTSVTVLFTEGYNAVPWTKPDELSVPESATLVAAPGSAPVGGAFADGFHAVMADGRITFYKHGYLNEDVVRMLNPGDGLVVDPLGHPEKILYSLPPVPPGKPK